MRNCSQHVVHTVAVLLESPSGTPALQADLEVAREQNIHAALEASRVKPADVARITLEAIRKEQFYILTHPNIKGAVRARMETTATALTPGPESGVKWPT